MKLFLSIEMLVIFVPFLLCGLSAAKECTNTVTQSHTVRYELTASKNETWKKEVFSHYHLTPTDDSAWSSLLPRKILKEEDEVGWEIMYKKMKNQGGFVEYGDFLKEISLEKVRLDPNSMHGRAQQTNLEYLLMLDVDKLGWNFRKTANLPTPDDVLPYGGWEAKDCELRGHFVGHYLSATAQMWASTHNDTLKEKMSELVSNLYLCQENIGSGYLSAFPSELFDKFEAVVPVWAPYYTIHKIMAGLLDQYTLAGNTQAFKMVTWMADYFYKRVQNVIIKYSIERHYQSLNEETGGMNDVLYRLYSVTNDTKHLVLAHLFDKPCFLGVLAVQADDISNFHANTHIPIVVGSQMRYEVTGDPLYKEISKYFMDMVNSSHSYATGGTSVNEHWSDPKRLASTLQSENEESCTTYNMLKVSRNLFRWTKEVAYADYYERALTNGVLSIQRGTDPGVMIYMLPLNRGSSKAKSYHGWGTKFESFWCCYGTGIESFSKLGDSIYFEEEGEEPALYVVQYISSRLDWESGQIQIDQKVDPVYCADPYIRITFSFSSKEGASRSSTLNLRIPSWTHLNGATAMLNSKSLTLPAPGTFLSVPGKWSTGDKLTLELPLSLRTEPIQDDRQEYASIQAILFGPYLLAAHSDSDWDINVPSTKSFSDLITPIPSDYNTFVATFSQELGNSTFVVSNSNHAVKMDNFPDLGTVSAPRTTFRLILKGPSLTVSTLHDTIGKKVSLEPFDFPGMVISHTGPDHTIGIADSRSAGLSSVFHLVEGLDGRKGSVSFESEDNKGCFLYSAANYDAGLSMTLRCKSGSADTGGFSQASSFLMRKGVSQYHPISFVAKGARRNYLLAPLLSFTDEFYTVYFNITG